MRPSGGRAKSGTTRWEEIEAERHFRVRSALTEPRRFSVLSQRESAKMPSIGLMEGLFLSLVSEYSLILSENAAILPLPLAPHWISPVRFRHWDWSLRRDFADGNAISPTEIPVIKYKYMEFQWRIHWLYFDRLSWVPRREIISVCVLCALEILQFS